MAYDAENRLVAFCPNDSPAANCLNQLGNGRTLYVYDGLGNRVQKQGSGGTTTYVYDAFGNLAAEYGSVTQAAGTQYLTADALGSTRLATGSQTERHDFEPFGLEALANGWRGNVAGYGVDTVRQKFAGVERDAETGLDFMQARYSSSVQGRFLSPDPDSAGAMLGDSQSWNGYGYVSNNPLTYTDPDGQGIFGFLGWFVGGYVGHQFGELVDALIFGPNSTRFDNAPDIGGTLGGCGGPLGTCGTLGNGPWSEQSGLGSVQDPQLVHLQRTTGISKRQTAIARGRRRDMGNRSRPGRRNSRISG